jgi:DNA-binding transcriptional ArsR family regulator
MTDNSYDSATSPELCCLSEIEASRLLEQNVKVDFLHDFVADLRAVAEAGRWQILSLLRQQELCVNDLTALMKSDQTQISHQLRRLKAQGLVQYRKEGKMSFYSLQSHPLLDQLFAAFDTAQVEILAGAVEPGAAPLEAKA